LDSASVHPFSGLQKVAEGGLFTTSEVILRGSPGTFLLGKEVAFTLLSIDKVMQKKSLQKMGTPI